MAAAARNRFSAEYGDTVDAAHAHYRRELVSVTRNTVPAALAPNMIRSRLVQMQQTTTANDLLLVGNLQLVEV